jgi:uncharacterized protein involved in high-affinity Fe2+ transport
MRAVLAVPLLLLAIPAHAVEIGAPVVRDGVEITPSYQPGVTLDRMMAPPGSVHLEADVHATKDEPHGFAPGAFIPYLTISWSLTRDDNPTFKKAGLLYPMVAKAGPHYGGAAELAGPGTYHLTYIVSPPTSHGLLRHTDKDSGVPDWFKPITATWTFTYPEKTP